MKVDERGEDVFICKVCKKWVKHKDFHVSIRVCKKCIEPYLDKKK